MAEIVKAKMAAGLGQWCDRGCWYSCDNAEQGDPDQWPAIYHGTGRQKFPTFGVAERCMIY